MRLWQVNWVGFKKGDRVHYYNTNFNKSYYAFFLKNPGTIIGKSDREFGVCGYIVEWKNVPKKYLNWLNEDDPTETDGAYVIFHIAGYLLFKKNDLIMEML